MVSIGIITKALRIPELKYEISNQQETEEVVEALCDFLASCAQDRTLLCGETSLTKSISSQGETFRLSPRIYNSLFLCDRLTDVFYRKANIDDQLKDKISDWRFALARLVIQFPSLMETEDSPILKLIDTICASQMGWSQEPKRVAQTVLDRLDKIHDEMLSIKADAADHLNALIKEWEDSQNTQDARIAKSYQRLVTTEQGVATSRYATEFSVYTLGCLLKGQSLPHEIGEFILSKWQLVLRNALLKMPPSTGQASVDWPSLETLTKRLVFVFAKSNSQRNESLFAKGEGLVDELAAVANQYAIEVTNEQWESIQQLLISVLQGVSIDRCSVTIRHSEINFTSDALPTSEEIQDKTGAWYLIKQNGTISRLKFANYFEDSREILWLNHAGMKSLNMAFDVFKQGLNDGSIKRLKDCYLLSQVFNETLKGLGKVAQAQHKAREEAKRKAEAEAEQLRLAKKKAEELVRLKEQEAAKRLQEQRLQVAEKERLEKEQATLKLISDMSIGAWISVSEEESKQKYKLVVKINATDKLIFVDKMGLKKLEIKTPKLMGLLISGTAEILSDGAEFDDTLSRVVGRLRVGK